MKVKASANALKASRAHKRRNLRKVRTAPEASRMTSTSHRKLVTAHLLAGQEWNAHWAIPHDGWSCGDCTKDHQEGNEDQASEDSHGPILPCFGGKSRPFWPCFP